MPSHSMSTDSTSAEDARTSACSQVPLLVDASDGPAAAVDGEVLPVLVDPGTKTGRAELEGHQGVTARPAAC